MIAFEDLHKDIIVFSYQTGPVMGKEGEDGGFSISLYGNGNLRYCTYRFFEQIRLLEMFKLSRDETKQIYDIIAASQNLLETIPGRLDNGSKDGCSNEFEFLGHEKIRVWNIRWSFVQGVRLYNNSYYKEYQGNMEQENAVLTVFENICKCLKKMGISLSLTECEMQDGCRMRITWQE